MLTLRSALPQDAEAIAALIHDLGQSFINPGEESLATEFWASVSVEAEHAYIADPARRMIVAIDGERLARVIALRDAAHVFHLFVDRRFQHLGLGTRLWEALLAELKPTLGSSFITVNAALTARTFYRKLGFVDAGAPLSKHGVTTVPMRFEPNLVVREEMHADCAAITTLTVAAFESLEISDHTEQFIVEALRAAQALAVSLVALYDGRIVGHIAFSPVSISDGATQWYGLGPVSVLPERQRQGIGKALIHTGLASLQTLGAAGCCLVGHPEYYRKFGFTTVAGLGVEGVAPEYCFALSFNGAMPQGTITFHDAFMATGQTA